MARIAIAPRPPVLSSLCLLAAAVLLEPRSTRVVQLAPDPLGEPPPCMVAGTWHGDLLVPDGLWNMPVLHPQGHWRTPLIDPGALAPLPNVLAPGAVIPLGHWDSDVEGEMIDVDRLVSALKHLLRTPAT